MREYLAEEWRELLAHNQLDDFQSLWDLQGGWVEAPNERRGGWSGVSRIELKHADGASTALFVKRQQDHVYRNWRYPLRGRPTFMREMYSILAYRDDGIPSLEPVYFGRRNVGAHQQALLVTVALDGFIALESLLGGWESRAQRLSVIDALADLIRAIHGHGYWHGCLYPKHLLVRLDDDRGSVREVRIIDLEKSRRSWRIDFDRVRDLAALTRRITGLSRSDRMRFLLRYLGTPRLTDRGKALWRGVERRRRARASQQMSASS
jgi:hypothetical protein